QRLVAACLLPRETGDLERVERVSTAGAVEPPDLRTGEADAERRAEHDVELAGRERSDADAREPRAERAIEPERRRPRLPGAARREHGGGNARQPPDDERERALARRVEPLDVVDREQQTAALRGELDEAQRRAGDGDRARPAPFQRRVERRALR